MRSASDGLFGLPPSKHEFNVPRSKLLVNLREARNVVLGRFFFRFKFQSKELRSSVSRESAFPSWKEEIVFEDSSTSLDGVKDSPVRSLKALGQRSVRIAEGVKHKEFELEVVMVRKSKWGADHEVGMVRLDLAKTTRRAENWFVLKTQARIMGDDAEASTPEVLLWIEFQHTLTERVWYRRHLHDYVLKKLRQGEEEKKDNTSIPAVSVEHESGDEDELGYPLDLAYGDELDQLKAPLVTNDMFVAYRRAATTFHEEPANTAGAGESVYNRDWEINELLQFNARFQQAVEVLNNNARWETDPNQVLSAARNLITVSQDFLFSAKTYGKIIISERFLPDDKKTIKPIPEVGGKIGGIKYVHQGVFYKFALPDGSIVTTVEEAAKVAGHELRGCMSYYNCAVPGLAVPLMCLVDYRGFRLIAITVLPIGRHTLVGGTSDAGRNIHSSDPALNRKLTKAAHLLNLKQHVVRGHTVYSACDLEGHFNHADGRHYLLDFSRVMPPAAPARLRSRRTAAAIFVQMLRPEFVSKYRVPLCSDAFSGFRDRSNKHRDEKDIVRACKDLSWLIPRFAAELSELVEQKMQQEEIAVVQASLSRLLHSKGINLRHLGALFVEASSGSCRMLLLIEMVSRAVKVLCRKRLRELMESLTYPLEQPYIEATVQLLNAVFAGDESVWQTHILPHIADYFGVAFGNVKKRNDSKSETLNNNNHNNHNNNNNSNNDDKSANADVYDDLGSSQGSLSSSGVSEKKQLAPRSKTEPDVAAAAVPQTHAPDDSGEDDEEQQHVADKSFSIFASLRNALRSKKPVEAAAALLPVYDSVLDPAPAMPPPRIDSPFEALHAMPCGMSLLLTRLVTQLGLRFSDRVNQQINASLSQRSSAMLLTKRRAFDVSDLQELGERVKPLNIVPEAQGHLFVHQAKQHALTVQDELHYYQLAVNCFTDALAGNTISKSVLRAFADVLMDTETAAGRATLDSRSPTARRIAELYQEALRIDEEDFMVLRQYGIFLTKCGQFEDAKLVFLQSIHFCPNQDSVQRYCSLLGNNSDEADEMVKAWEIYRTGHKE